MSTRLANQGLLYVFFIPLLITILSPSTSLSQDNYALQFDGVDDYIQVPNDESLEMTEMITIETWMKHGKNDFFNWEGFIYKGDVDWSLNFIDSQGHLNFEIKRTYGDWAQCTASTIPDMGEWYHVAATYDGNQMKIYVNGILENTTAVTGNLTTSGLPLFLGVYHGIWGYGEPIFYNGVLDEIRIWNIVRSESEIYENMYSLIPDNTPSLVAYWTFDEGSGDIVYDRSQYHNDGKLYEGAQWVNSDLVEVQVGVHAPTGLRAVVGGESVFLCWSAPRTSEGLIGYLVYRDGEVINASFVVDAAYVDDNPGAGIHNYTVASFYNEGNVYFAPEILEVFVCAGGTGEPGDPFQIATAQQLAAIGSHPSLLDRHYALISDIDLDPNLPGRQIFDRAVIAPDTSDMDEGFQGSAFAGTFDGNGHTLSNLTIEGNSYLGLFGALGREAQVIDVNVVNADVTGNGWNIGAIAGTNGGTVQECYTSGLVTGYSDVGGLVGSNDHGQIIDSHSTADVVGIEYVGGMVGSHLVGAVYSSNATGSVFGWHWVGGLVGFNQGTVSKCSGSGFVSGSSFLGGLVGYNDSSGVLSNCYSDGTVLGDDTLGGLVGGNAGTVGFTYSVGKVMGMSGMGGLVGKTYPQAQVVASFWDIDASGQPSSDGGMGLTTAELQQVNTYVDAGWDFAGESDNGTENFWYMTRDSYARFFSFQGTGTRDDPYQIDTVWHLLSLGSDPDMLDKHFKLTTHIDLDPNLLGSRVFTCAVIAPDVNLANDDYDGIPFSGTFDGCGYEIRHLHMVGSGHLGLFGALSRDAHVSNLHLVMAHIEGAELNS